MQGVHASGPRSAPDSAVVEVEGQCYGMDDTGHAWAKELLVSSCCVEALQWTDLDSPMRILSTGLNDLHHGSR